MPTLQTTAIMKTDVSGSTVRYRALPEADLHALFIEHREFLARHAAAHGGRIVKPEGDGFWLVFPSVTAAGLAAMAMQEELRLAQPNKGDDRLAMRVVIALGDVLHEDGALVGDTVVLAARIEALTPADEIYLSASAWLAVNQAEIRTAPVGAFSLKGFAEAVPIYRVEQTHRTRVIADQYIVFTDLRSFSRLLAGSSLATVERVLDRLFELINQIARGLNGTIRFNAGDAYCLTFGDPDAAVAAAERLSAAWEAFVRAEELPCPVNIAIHQGIVYAFRSYLYGPGLEVASGVERASTRALEPGEGGIFLTGEARQGLAGPGWDRRLRRIDVGSDDRRLTGVEIYRLGTPET
jgi:class 3 adenylate cyclase